MTFLKKFFGFGKTVEPKITAPLIPPCTIKIEAVEPIVAEIATVEPTVAEITAVEPIVAEIAAVEPGPVDIDVDELIVADFQEDGPMAVQPTVLPIPTKVSPIVVSESTFQAFDRVIQYPTAFELRKKRIKQKAKINRKTAPKSKFRKIAVL